MSIPKSSDWRVTATVTVTTTQGEISRSTPMFSVTATGARDAFSKARDVLTVAWHGPSKIEFQIGMCDDGGNYWAADQNGLKG